MAPKLSSKATLLSDQVRYETINFGTTTLPVAGGQTFQLQIEGDPAANPCVADTVRVASS